MSALPHEDLALRAQPLPDQAKTLEIRDQLGYEGASNLLLTIQALLREAEDFFREPKQKAAAAHAAICAAERKVTDPLTKARDLLKNKMSGYIQHQMDLAEIANRVARDEAARQHAEEIEAQVEEAESRGATAAEVRAILHQQTPLPAPVAKPVAAVKGISPREDWLAEITDLRKFVEASLRDNRIFSVIDVHQGRLNQLVRVLKDSLGDVPGLRVMRRPVISASRMAGRT
jgi:hypothetical protein